MKVYGIKNCNSVKKALEFLDKKALEFDFIDIKKIDLGVLENWLKYIKDLVKLSILQALLQKNSV